MRIIKRHLPEFSVLSTGKMTGLPEALLTELQHPRRHHSAIDKKIADKIARSLTVSKNDLGEITEIRVARDPFRKALKSSPEFRATLRVHVEQIGESRTKSSRERHSKPTEKYVAEAKAVGAGVWRPARSSGIGTSASFQDTVENLAPYAPLAALLAIFAAVGYGSYRLGNATEKMAQGYADRITDATNIQDRERPDQTQASDAIPEKEERVAEAQEEEQPPP